MKLRRHALLCLCLLVILTSFGCSTFRRDRFLTTHSSDRLLADRPQAAKLLEQYPALAQWLRTEWNRPIVEYRIQLKLFESPAILRGGIRSIQKESSMTPAGASRPTEFSACFFNMSSTGTARSPSGSLVNIPSAEAFRDVVGSLLGAVNSAGVSAAPFLIFIPLPPPLTPQERKL